MKNLLILASVACLFSCGQKQEAASSTASEDSSAAIVMVENAKDYTDVLDNTMNNLAEKNVAEAVSAYSDSIQFIHPSGAVTHTKKELEDALSSRISVYSSLNYTSRTYIAFDVKKPSRPDVTPGVYVTGWMWSTVKNAKGDSVRTPMTLTLHFNKDKQVDFAYSTYDLKGRSDMMAK